MHSISRRAMIFGGFTALARAGRLQIGDSAIHVQFLPGGEFAIGQARVLDWVNQAARAVSTYFGRFPVPETSVRIRPRPNRGGIANATTYGGPPPFTRISVGEQVTGPELLDDWVMTHEFVHLGFPSVIRRHHWIEEGIATYVEPVARVQAGQLSAVRMWADVVRDMPKGQPEEADRGLDNTHTWGRTYWGGGLFCLAADVAIRERTQNRKGLQHALRAILNQGGTIDQEWPLSRAFETGDKETGVPVLTELYDKMKDSPVEVDLATTWKRLGIARSGDSVTFDDKAPLAAVRRAITASFR